MNNNKKIIITGANGTIGQILQAGLPEYQITLIDLPKRDLRIYETLSSIASGHCAIIHLAWATKADNFNTETDSEENSRMFFNVYQTAVACGVPRVIMASSVHADGFHNWKGPGHLSPNRIPTPESLYGVHKVYMETMGRYVAAKGLEVVCVRFGSINLADQAHRDHVQERTVFLSRADCVSLVKSILQAETIPENFAIVYAVSDNAQRVHDLTNPFHWFPKDKAEQHLD